MKYLVFGCDILMILVCVFQASEGFEASHITTVLWVIIAAIWQALYFNETER